MSGFTVLKYLDLILKNCPYMGIVMSMLLNNGSHEQSLCSDDDANCSKHNQRFKKLYDTSTELQQIFLTEAEKDMPLHGTLKIHMSGNIWLTLWTGSE